MEVIWLIMLLQIMWAIQMGDGTFHLYCISAALSKANDVEQEGKNMLYVLDAERTITI